MPNHITNIIELKGSFEDVNKLIAEFGTHHKATLLTTDDGELICENKNQKYDFCWFNLQTGKAHNRNGLNQIGVPVGFEPEIRESFFAFPDFAKVIPPPDDPAYRDEPSQEIAKESPNWWYNWNCKHWGTKWGGYDYETKSINVYKFETAWSSVSEIITAISLKYPNVTIIYLWADEDTGHNVGKQIYHNGLLDETIPKGGTIEAYDLAFEADPSNKENYVLTDGKYKYKESE